MDDRSADHTAATGSASAPHSGNGAGRIALLVLGMHRSGTSALTRTMNLLGAALPGNLMAARPANEAGFWESVDIQRLNDRILAALDSHWDDWRPLDTARLDPATHRELLDEAGTLLRRDFAEAALFVLKDPRICRLAPFWREAIAHFGAETRAVIPLRNPAEVAASLQQRNGFALHKGHILWLRHALDAEHATRGWPRAIVAYADLLNDWRGVTAEISQRLAIRYPRAVTDAAADLDGFLVDRLRHHAVDTDTFFTDPDVSHWVREATEALWMLREQPEDPASLDRLDALRNELDRASEALGPLFGAEIAARQSAHATVASKEEEHRETAEALQLQRATAEEQARALHERDARIREQASRIEALQDAHREAVTERDRYEQGVRWHQERANELKRGIAWQKQRIDRLATEHRQQRDLIATHETALAAERRRNLAALSQRLATLRRLHRLQWQPAPWKAARWRPARRHDETPVHIPRSAPPLRLFGATTGPREHARLMRQARMLRGTGFFDAEWYLLRYPDIALDGAHPLWHWLAVGWREGREPNPLFDPQWYLEQYPDVAEAGLNPLFHYMAHGPDEMRAPGPHFDPRWYLATYRDVARAGIDPLRHYLHHGQAENRSPGPDFDLAWYRRQYPEIERAGIPALWHYLLVGRDEGRPGRRSAPHSAASAAPARRVAAVQEKIAPDSAQARELIVTPERAESARAQLARTPVGRFSVIMPTWNRRDVIGKAIDSVIAQSYADWELIVCDDGSTDKTADYLQQRYGDEIASGRLRYLALPHGGVCKARNAGLRAARGTWIAWLDSDNTWHPDYLLMTAAGYARHPEKRTAYACVHVHDQVRGHEFIRYLPFDWSRLLARNYIDLNVFSHHREVYEALGGFDESLTRLVDWDLILRYTHRHQPVFNPYAMCAYYIADHLSNITLTESLANNEAAIRRKFAEVTPPAPPEPEPAPTPAVEPAPPPATPASFSDFESFERRSLFLPPLRAPFTEEAKRVIGHMHAAERHRRTLAATRGSNERVSVILRTGSDGEAAHAAARSVLAQTHDNLELLLVGSAAAVALAEALADPRVRAITGDEPGTAAERNAGLAAAGGEHVMWLEAHHRLTPHALAILVDTLQREPDAPLAYCAQAIRQPGCGDGDEPDAVTYALFARAMLENRDYIDLGSVLVRRADAGACGGFRPEFEGLSGHDFLLRVTRAHAAVAVPCLLSERHDGTTTSTPAPDAERNALRDAMARTPLAEALSGYRVPGLEAMFAPQHRVAPAARRPISVVIPSFECPDHLALCIASVRAFTEAPCELIVVDNASSRPVRDYLAGIAGDDDVHVIQNERNYGFTYAVNQGIAQARSGNDIVLLNNDAVVSPGWDGAMQRVLEDVPDAGLVVSRQVLLAGTKTTQTHSPACDPEREIDVNLSVHHDNVLGALPGTAGYIELRFAPFFCVYIPRATLEAIGPLDHENAPHYRSDRLYCEAVRRIAEQRIIYTPHAKLYHFLQQATASLRDSDKDAYRSMFVRNAWGEIRGNEERAG